MSLQRQDVLDVVSVFLVVAGMILVVLAAEFSAPLVAGAGAAAAAGTGVLRTIINPKKKSPKRSTDTKKYSLVS